MGVTNHSYEDQEGNAHTSWSNYSDLTRPGPPQKVAEEGKSLNPIISVKSRLVKYF